MSFLDRIAACNNADLTRFLPFTVAGLHVGWIAPGFAGRLAAFPDVFAPGPAGVALAPHLDTPARRTHAVERALQRLAADGVVRGWRGERYPVAPFDANPFGGGKALMAIERAAIPHFGIRAYGVHMNGFVRRRGGLHLWIGHRAKDKPTYPGMLDNMVAGGQPAGLGLRENLVKECREEAAIPRALAARARPVGTISYTCQEGDTVKPDVMYCYDLELPARFVPRNTDGEIERFALMPVARVARIVGGTARFKFNCNLVIIDFLVRHGVIGPDHEDYLAICRGLRR